MTPTPRSRRLDQLNRKQLALVSDSRFYPLNVGRVLAQDVASVPDEAMFRFMAACNGRRSLKDVAQLCRLEDREALALAKQAMIDGTLVDVRYAYRTLHRLTANPAFAPPAFEEEEVRKWPRYRPETIGTAINASADWDDRVAMPVRVVRKSAKFSEICDTSPVPREALHRSLVRAHGITGARRTLASAGALYPIAIWVAWPVRTGHQSRYAVSWYDETTGALLPTGEHDTATLAAAIAPAAEVADMAEAGAGVIFLCADFHRTCSKYGNRGYRFALLEAGAAWQNIDLVLGDEGLPARVFGGFVDETCASLLSLPEHVVPLLTAFVGG